MITVSITDLIFWLLIGGVAGWLAGLVVRGGGFGLLGNIIVGILGAFIGGFLFAQFGVATYGLLGELFSAFVGALILLAIIVAIRRA